MWPHGFFVFFSSFRYHIVRQIWRTYGATTPYTAVGKTRNLNVQNTNSKSATPIWINDNILSLSFAGVGTLRGSYYPRARRTICAPFQRVLQCIDCGDYVRILLLCNRTYCVLNRRISWHFIFAIFRYPFRARHF